MTLTIRTLSALLAITLASTAAAQNSEMKPLRTRGASLLFRDGKPAVVLALPDGYEAESMTGPDFTVLRVFRKGAGLAAVPGFILYVGNYPGITERQEHPDKVVELKEPALGRQITWHCWHRSSGERPHLCEALISGLVPDQRNPPSVLQIMATGGSEEELREWRHVADESLVCKACLK